MARPGGVILFAVLAIGCKKSGWDGKSPLVCTNNETISLVDCEADLPGQTAIRADNNCTITLERCTVTADTAISADNNVTLHLIDTVLVGKATGISLENNCNVDAKRGRIEGGVVAMSLDSHVHVVLSDTMVVGRVRRVNDSTVEGLPALEAEQAAERIADQFGPNVCDLAFGCYGARYLGTLAGRFTVELDAKGAVLATHFEGEAPEAVRACLTSAGDKRVDGFTGPKGRLECAYSGTLGPSSSTMDRGWKFVPGQ